MRTLMAPTFRSAATRNASWASSIGYRCRCGGPSGSRASSGPQRGDTALLPAQRVAQGAGGHAVLVVLREHRQDLVVGPGQARFLQAPFQVHVELMMRVLEGPPGAVFTRVQPVRFHQPSC